jgi:hypothetical protein
MFVEAIVVRARLTFPHRLGGDAERHLRQDGRFEDSLWPDQRNAHSVELEAF